MFRNYFKTALRSLLKNRFYTALNIAGLTTGLAIGILILLWVRNELSYDTFHRNAGSIYHVTSNMGTGAGREVWSSSHAPLAVMGKREVPEIAEAVRVKGAWEFSLFEYKDRRFTKDAKSYVDPAFFTMFDFKLLKGNRQQPFQGNYSVVLTEAAARRYFGDEEPIGKILTADNKEHFTVTGVLENFPENSSIRADMLFPMSLYAKLFPGNGQWKTIDEDWGNFNYDTYLQLKPGASKAAVEKKLAASLARNYRSPGFSDPYGLRPLTNIHLYNTNGSEGAIQTVRIFLIVGILILLIACINYVNLSTARSLLRAKEVSVRKMIGAARSQLFIQFMLETAIVFVVAAAVAMLLSWLLMPAYNSISGKNIVFSLTDPGIWALIGVTVAASLLLSSIYPAALLSSFEPLKALKGKVTAGFSTAFFRKALVTTQFVFSVALITGTLVIGRQMQYIANKELGYDKEHVFRFYLRDMSSHEEAVKTALMRQPGIHGISFSNEQIVDVGNTTGDTDWDGKEPGRNFYIHTLGIDTAFLPLLKIPVVQGHGFSGIASDSMHVILNETAVKEAGIVDPVGKRFTLWDTKAIIIGVVKDFHFASLKKKIEPAVFFYQPVSWSMYVKTTAGEAPKALAAVESLWKTYNPTHPFEYTFLDQTYESLYRSEQRTGKLFSIFSAIAIFISCLGLFGLATYTAQVKTKEIGIRKVLGAGVGSIVQLLARDFLLLVLIAICIATPLAWFGMHHWLQDFAYRVPLSWWMFALAGSLAVLIALLTVSFQSVKAALVNPVKSLRSE